MDDPGIVLLDVTFRNKRGTSALPGLWTYSQLGHKNKLAVPNRPRSRSRICTQDDAPTTHFT